MPGTSIKTDVLIIGGGGAGFRAAIGARETGVEVTLVSKGPLARSGATPMAGADFTLDGKSLHDMGYKGAPNDSFENVFNDIVIQGFYLNNQKLVEHYVRNAPERLRELIDWGLKITGSEERAVYSSGLGIMRVLLKKARSLGIEMIEDVMLLDLITKDGRVTGALGLDIKKGEFILFKSGAVIIATGGWHKAFWPNTGMRDLSGEGIAMAHRAGADIGNMEFITFCNNVFYEPPIWQGSIAPYIVSLLSGGELTNTAGEKVFEKYDPITVKAGSSTEWNKCFVSFIAMKEVREGKGLPNGGLYYSRGDVPWETFEPPVSSFFPNRKYKAIDLSEFFRKLKANEPVVVGPAAEYFDGGIVINENYESTIEGLFAAGECTLGPFGANRIFSAITEILVHGAQAGNNAGNYARNVQNPEFDGQIISVLQEKVEYILKRKEGIRPGPVRRKIQEKAHRYLNPVRTGEELKAFIDFLENVKKDEMPHFAVSSSSRIYNKEWVDAIEIENMVHLLEVSAKSALFRKESRGVHYREDYPVTDNDRWLKETIVKKTEDGFKITARPVAHTGITPPEGVVPYLDMMKKMMELHSDIGGHH